MSEQIYLINAMLSIVLIVTCAIIDNKYISSRDSKDAKIQLEIDLSNPFQLLLLIISLMIILYIKYLTIIITFLYAGWIIIQIIKFKNQN
ncbi:hypothetical protein [Paramaledivibacter caminithermalis]|jgi:heme/copper-type cytochrome/quinol oxidase subunit 2|uniref:Uncharacterized protein n=1 Tax=Paramaledivibacter caminithermalis (strain DSM 15212 / CIP 107654 / DViRD3) TaxID=1121301 RepID=A0A1M6M8S0_PARC5|nr:hypothetical protein [Paramaledivibacter caminithermalis]SHJ79858.1 hypothetical protein SAMN02745912_01135 [Paramaledivibacter caminithermalis DSM 15212]